jgi:hypothetical protein
LEINLKYTLYKISGVKLFSKETRSIYGKLCMLKAKNKILNTNKKLQKNKTIPDG